MRRFLTIAAACAAALLMATAAAQARQKAADPDAAELRAYRLTPATLKKAIAATHAFAQALQNDPRFKSATAAEREMQTLEDKDERTPAEDRRVEELQKQIDEAQKQFEAESGSDDNDNAASIDDMARKLTGVPHMADAIKSAGFTPHEFALFQTALMQAGFAAGFKKAGLLKQMPPGVPPENVQFVLDHEAEIQEMQKAMSAAGGSPGR